MVVKALKRVFVIGCIAAPLVAGAQNTNPYDSDRNAIRAGEILFGNRCADCHGPDAKGNIGADLTLLWAVGTNDERVFQSIRFGVSGSAIPPSSALDNEIWAIVAYLKSISTVPPFESGSGNPRRGERFFSSNCTACHRVDGQGGTLGPDLSRIAQIRSRDMLTLAIRDPSASVATGYRAVTIVTRDGARVRGAVKSEDAFSIQILDTDERLQGYLKADLDEVIHEENSLMSEFRLDDLDERRLEDLLAFLGTLRELDTARP